MNEHEGMPLILRHGCFIPFLMMFLTLAHAQTGDKVILNHADSGIGLEIAGEQVRKLIGNVKFTHGRVIVNCDTAIQYMRSNRVDFQGNVVVRQDSLTMTAKRGTYFADGKIIEAFDDVHLDDGKTTLRAEYGKYFSEEKKSYFRTNVFAHDSTTTLSADELTYFRDDQKSIADGSVNIYNAENKITLTGHHFENFKKQNYSKMTLQPMAVEVDTASDGEIDTLVVSSRVMESYQDSLPRLVATDSVALTRAGLSATSGLGTFFTKNDSIVFRRSPVVWYTHSAWETTQVSGDSMFVKLNKRKLERLYVNGQAFALSRADSLQPLRYHQMAGQNLIMHFADNAIQRIEVDKTATVLYYIFDGKNPNGANRTSGDHVSILFLDKKIDKIKVKSGVEGEYFPEKMLKNKEDDFNLPGFKRQEQYRRASTVKVKTGQPSLSKTSPQ